MLIDMSNGSVTTQIMLKDVLYAPEVGYTLVSMGKIDAVGCNINLGQQRITICECNHRSSYNYG